MHIRRVILVVAAIATTVSLTGCANPNGNESPSSPTSASAWQASAAPTTPPTLPVDVSTSSEAGSTALFSVQAEYKSDDAKSRVRVTETVFQGVPAPTPQQSSWFAAADRLQKSASDASPMDLCSDMLAGIATPSYYRIAMTVDTLSGTLSGHEQITMALGTRPTDPATLSGQTVGNPCYTSSVPLASTEGVAVYPAGLAPSDPNGWLGGYWGSAYLTTRNSADSDVEWTTTSCRVILGPAAAGVSLPATWTAPVESCMVGTPSTD